MADSFSADFSDVARLSASIGRASSAVVSASVPVVAKGLLNIKNDTRATMSPHPSWRRLAQTVTYDQVGLSGEVGYEDRGQGELAGIYEFGSAHHAPHPTLIPAAAREAEKFEKALADVAEQAVRRLL